MTKRLRAVLLSLIFLSGFVGLSFELLVMRQLSFYVGSSAIISGIIIGAYLGFLSLGYFKGASGKRPAPGARNSISLSFILIALMLTLAASFATVNAFFQVMQDLGLRSIIWQTFLYSLLFLSATPFLLGRNTARLAAYLQKHSAGSAGKIMALDTIGSVIGSLAATLLLMPLVGVNHTIMLVVGAALASSILIRPRVLSFALAAPVMAFAVMINADSLLRSEFGIIVNNENSTILIENYGPIKVLNMNGLNMSNHNRTTGKSAEYVNWINDNFIYNSKGAAPREILVLGAGGFTIGLKDKYNTYTFVDIERTLKKVSEESFLGENLTPNKTFVIRDAGQFLKAADKKYDLIVLDVYTHSYRVPEDFITEEFMQRIKDRVAEGGIIVMNVIQSPNFADKYSQVFDNTFHRVFPYNTQRQVVGRFDAWSGEDRNVMYVYYNRPNDGRVYTINRIPIIYDRK